MLGFSIVSWLRGFAKSGLKNGSCGGSVAQDVGKICTTPARERDLEVKIVRTPWVRITFGSWASQICTTSARESDFCEKKKHAACSEDFWKLSSAKFAPRLRARSIWKSKALKTDGLGMFLEVQNAFRVAGAGISTRCKIRDRRRSSSGVQKRWQAWWIWRGSETMRFARQAQWFRALWCRCLKPPTLNPWKGCKFHVTEVLLGRHHFAWQLQEFVCLGSTFSWQARYFWSIYSKNRWNVLEFWGQVSGRHVIFWRKSRRNASFLSFKASFLKEVSQKRLNPESIDTQITWIPNQLTTKIIWISSHLTTNSLESQIIWRPNQLNLRRIDNQNHLNIPVKIWGMGLGWAFCSGPGLGVYKMYGSGSPEGVQNVLVQGALYKMMVHRDESQTQNP